jgi:hypothetical protein
MAKSKNGTESVPAAKTTMKKAATPRTKKAVIAKSTAGDTLNPVQIEQEVRRRAYELFLLRNGNYGDPLGDWFTAEAEVKAKLTV